MQKWQMPKLKSEKSQRAKIKVTTKGKWQKEGGSGSALHKKNKLKH